MSSLNRHRYPLAAALIAYVDAPTDSSNESTRQRDRAAQLVYDLDRWRSPTWHPIPHWHPEVIIPSIFD